MTERTVISSQRKALAGMKSVPATTSDDDSISVTSTQASEPRDEYPVDKILAEYEKEGHMWYLAKWSGYDMDSCTWEPRENFDESTLDLWDEEKEKREQGLSTPFNYRAFDKHIKAVHKATAERKRRRMAKRRRLGIGPPSIIISSDDEGPLDRRSKPKPQESKGNQNTVNFDEANIDLDEDAATDAKRKKIRKEKRPRESHTESLNDDYLLEELTAKGKRKLDKTKGATTPSRGSDNEMIQQSKRAPDEKPAV